MSEWSPLAHAALPIGLGLLGFVEPCAIGGHMIVLRALAERPRARRLAALVGFVTTRAVVFGLVGVAVAFVGQRLIASQKAFWLVFGIAYAVLGGLYLANKISALPWRIGSIGGADTGRRGTVVLGALFGLSVPACAAPLLFAVAGGAAGAPSYAVGFMTMGLFGLALSAPLLLLGAIPALARALGRLRDAPTAVRRVLGVTLVGAGLWSIGFALFVDPADWRLGR